MKTKTFALILMLLASSIGTWAQQRIKTVDVTIEIPKVGTDVLEEVPVKSIITDVFGSENMLGEKKIDASVQVVTVDDYGNLCHLIAGDVYEPGRKYKYTVRTTNYTKNLYNYKNDKNFTADNTTVKATINGKKANITLGSGRPLTFEATFTMPGTRGKLETNTAVSAADGEHAGYGYVDLGLPSGTKWATCNLGASKPEALGDRYAYGETKTKNKFYAYNFTGYGAYTLTNPHGIKSFGEEDNMYSVKTSLGRQLKPEYDCARQNMGGEWNLPTRAQASELREYCYAKYTKVNGVEGVLYTSRKNGKSLFLPFTDKFKNFGGGSIYLTANSHRVKDMYQFWWGNSYSKDDNSGICVFELNTWLWNEDEIGGDSTYVGHYARAVWGCKNKITVNPYTGKISKGSNKKVGNDSKDSGVSTKDKINSAAKSIKKIGAGLKSIFK